MLTMNPPSSGTSTGHLRDPIDAARRPAPGRRRRVLRERAGSHPHAGPREGAGQPPASSPDLPGHGGGEDDAGRGGIRPHTAHADRTRHLTNVDAMRGDGGGGNDDNGAAASCNQQHKKLRLLSDHRCCHPQSMHHDACCYPVWASGSP